MNKDEIQQYSENHPLSVCVCGHTGDGGNSQHLGTLAQGHGPCRVEGCKCRRFTWTKWLPEFEAKLNEGKS